MKEKNILLSVGINYEDGVKRFSGYEEIYEKYLQRLIANTDFLHISIAMGQEKYTEAFEYAHALKGLLGNLSIERLYETISTFIEYLRNECNIPAAIQLYPGLASEYDQTIEAIHHYFEMKK